MSAIEEAASEQLDMEKPVQEEEESVPKSISDISAETATQDSGSQNKHDSQAKTTPQSGTEQGPEEGGEGSKPESAKDSSNQSEEQENAPQVNTAGSLPLSSEMADMTQPCKEQDKPGNNSSTAEPLDPANTNSEMGQLQASASQAEAAVTEPKTSVGDVAETEAETEAPMVQAESAKENDIPHETGSLEQKEESIIPDEVATATKLPTETVEVEGATAAAPSNTSTPTSENKAPIQSVYHIKWLKFRNQNLPIVTQNENGPCPLLAIMNVLLLKGQVKFPPMIEMVTSGQLMDYLGDCIFENAPKNISEDARLNYEQNMHDAMAVFHKLQTGLDVNVRFTGISDFEYTPECIVFDLLAIPLYHGWLVDPESPEMTAAVSNCSYNQLVEKIISNKNSNKEELMTEALLAEEFLERTAAQLTYHGLSELSSQTKESELCVFFRNNHFSTVYKHKTELFLLVTDQGFLTESGVVWETLSNVEGDGHFVDADFRTYTKPEPSTATIPAPVVPPGSDQQIDTDYLVALSLQQEGQETQTQDASWQSSQGSEGDVPAGTNVPPGPQPLSDHELAMHLQEEENQRAAAMQQRQQQRQVQRQTSRERKKSDNCVII